MIFILHGGNINSAGGMEIHCRYLVKYLRTTEELFLITKNDSSVRLEQISNKQVSVFKSIKCFIDYIRTYSPSVLFFNDGYWIENVHDLRKVFPKSIMIMRSGGNEFVKAPYHDMMLPLSKRQKIWANIINNNIDFVIANSQYSWLRMLDSGFLIEKCVIIKGGVDLDFCRKNYQRRKDLRQIFDNKYGTFNSCLFCIVARLVPFKGISNIIDTFSKLKNSKNWFLLIIGDGPEFVKLSQNCREFLPHNKYCFLGEVPHDVCLEYIALSDYLISPSLEYLKKSGNDYYIHTETMGRAIIEAICQQTLVIANPVGGVVEWKNLYPQSISLVNDSENAWEEQIISAIANKSKENRRAQYNYYQISWDFIINGIYKKLFEMKQDKVDVILCFDLDGSVIHKFCNQYENNTILKELINLTNEKVMIIINTAGNYDRIVCEYPAIRNNLQRIIVISDCGLTIHYKGIIDEFWHNYNNLLFPIKEEDVLDVTGFLERNKKRVLGVKRINKFYVNIKIDRPLQNQIMLKELNEKLRNSMMKVVCNGINVKIISKIVNKGGALRYLNNYNLKWTRAVGIGNNVLDEEFLMLCDYRHSINGSVKGTEIISSFDQMIDFCKKIQREVALEG